MALYFLTGNETKFAEVQGIIPEVERLEIDLPELQSLDAHEIIRAKLVAAKEHHEGAFIVEDTSFYIDGLNGLPGTLIKWFLETIQPAGLYTLAQAFGSFGAEAKTVIGYLGPEGERFFEGTVRGTLVPPRLTHGFGWDLVFVPEGETRTFAEMSKAEKGALSMRGEAARKCKVFLESRNL